MADTIGDSRNLGVAEGQRDQEAGEQNAILNAEEPGEEGLGLFILGAVDTFSALCQQRRRFIAWRHSGDAALLTFTIKTVAGEGEKREEVRIIGPDPDTRRRQRGKKAAASLFLRRYLRRARRRQATEPS